MHKFAATLFIAALMALILTETMQTQELRIDVAMGTNRAFLEIAARVKPCASKRFFLSRMRRGCKNSDRVGD